MKFFVEHEEDGDDDDDDGGGRPKAQPKTNKIGKPMGSNLHRPMGQKATKRLEKVEITATSTESERMAILKGIHDAQQNVDTVDSPESSSGSSGFAEM
jgi:hypothetical protein